MRCLYLPQHGASITLQAMIAKTNAYGSRSCRHVRYDADSRAQPGMETNWSTRAVTHRLQKVVSGESTRVIISIPPRNLKSICSSVALPAFLLGHNPTKKIICVSYSDDLAVKFFVDCRAVLRSDWYQRIFPGTRGRRSTPCHRG
jgi:hypothetical protein